MIDLEKTKTGDLLLGRKERGVDDRWRYPLVRFVGPGIEEGLVEVNDHGESKQVRPEDLFTIQGTLYFQDKQLSAARRKIREMQSIFVNIAMEAAKQSPDVALQLAPYLNAVPEP